MEAYRLTHPRTRIEARSYGLFLMELPLHVLVPPHSLATDEEVDALCRLHTTSRDRFPHISRDDPQAVWLGVKPGMVVRIDRPSETAGIAVVYRFCV